MPNDQALLQSLHGYLEGLQRTPDGQLLYKLIVRGLKKYGDGQVRIEPAFVSFLQGLLARYIADPEHPPAVRIKARMIQQRLLAYLQAAPMPARDSVAVVAAEAQSAAPVVADAAAADAFATTPIERVAPPVAPTAPALVGDEMAAFEELKSTFLRGLDELIHSRQELQQQLSGATEYMRAVQQDRDRLQQELASAQRQGLVDAVTGLPTREVFVRMLSAEIGRVKRYGFALAVALIDIDGLGAVNERHGRNAGDALLRCYARDILSQFRGYDLVARYGGDEFAVLFPNTQKEGAIRALDKVRTLVRESVLTLGARALPLPTFSSALAMYAPGEEPTALLTRADQALLAAKGAGGGRNITALSAH